MESILLVCGKLDNLLSNLVGLDCLWFSSQALTKLTVHPQNLSGAQAWLKD